MNMYNSNTPSHIHIEALNQYLTTTKLERYLSYDYKVSLYEKNFPFFFFYDSQNIVFKTHDLKY